MVGSSIATKGNASTQSVEQIVSPIFILSMPEIATISPTSPLSTSTRFKPSN